MTPDDRLRQICMALPDACERETWGSPTFRVRDRIFAMIRRDDGRVAVWIKASAGAQEVLIGAAPERFFRPPYVGPKGWIGVWLDDAPDWAPDWADVAAHVRRSYGLIAPRKLAKLLE